MTHTYIRFGKGSAWYHLDIILSEDKNGKIYLKHFYTTPIPTENNQLRPGVVC